MKLEYVGKDDWSRHTYRDENGRYWKDVEPEQDIYSSLYSVCPNAYDGEPAYPLCEKHEFKNVEITFKTERIVDSPYSFTYMLLGRLKQDCNYYLGNGGRSEKRLWGITLEAHLNKMKDLWNSLPQGKKPEWLTWNDILEYEKMMLKLPM